MEDLRKSRKAEYDKDYYQKHKDKRLANGDSYYSRNRENVLARQKRLRDYWKREVVKHFGGCCGRCGFSDVRALQVDHVSGGGNRDQKRRTSYKYYIHVIEDTSGRYQLLCANCNTIKKIENGEHRKIT